MYDIFSQTFDCELKDSSCVASTHPPAALGLLLGAALKQIPGWSRGLLPVPLQPVRWEQRGPELGRPSAAAEAPGIVVRGEGKLFDQHIFLIGSRHPGVSALP